MNKNTIIRGVLLTVLVALSIALSYFIWKGKPDYEAIDVKETEKTAIDKPRTVSQVFRPVNLQVNEDDTHYQTTASNVLNNLVLKSREISFSEVVFSGKKRASEYENIVHRNNTVEMIYPCNIPFSIFSQSFQIHGKNLNEATFNRIIFDMKDSDLGFHTVYFANDQDEIIYQSSLQQKDMDSIKNTIKDAKKRNELRETPEAVGAKQQLFVSRHPLEMSSKKFIIDTMDINVFTKSLFQDSGSVKNEDNSYTNGSSKIVLDPDNKVLQYINPAQEQVNPEAFAGNKRIAMIQDSFNFINEHSGWTGNFFYTGYDAQTGVTEFSLFVNNLQVINPNGMATLSVAKGQEDVYKYIRPFFKLDSQIPRESGKVKLPASAQVYERLQQRTDIVTSDVKMILLGYKMSWASGDGLNRIVQLEPTWLYLYKNKWYDANMKERE